ESMRHALRNDLTPQAVVAWDTEPRPAHVIGIIKFQRLNTPANVLSRIYGMRIDPHHYFAPAGGDSDIQCMRCNPMRIVDKTDERESLGVLGDDLSSAILAHSVNDKNFQLFLWKVIVQDAVETFSDELALVAAGDDDRHLGGADSLLCRVEIPAQVAPAYHPKLSTLGSDILSDKPAR